MASTANFALNVSLPFYPHGAQNATGGQLTLTQSPCNDVYHRNLCCGTSRGQTLCANWTGAHLISRGCILYGSLTAELALHLPKGSFPFVDFGSYMYGGEPDPTMNELDMVWTTASVSNNATNVYDSYRTTEYTAGFFNPLESKQVFGPFSEPRFSGLSAAEYHNYTIAWTPDWLAWLVDDLVFMNQTRWRAGCTAARCFHRSRADKVQTLIPWRPQTVRIILRTADGTAYPQPQAHVMLRRLSYFPLAHSPGGLAVLESRVIAVGRRTVTVALTLLALLAMLMVGWRLSGGSGDDRISMWRWLFGSFGDASSQWRRLHWDLPASQSSTNLQAEEDRRRLRDAVAAVRAQGVQGAERLPLLPRAAEGDRMRAAAARAALLAASERGTELRAAPPPLRGTREWGRGRGK
jgi:hypothetical protein